MGESLNINDAGCACNCSADKQNTKQLNIGVIGCGTIFKAYAETITSVEGLNLIAVADINMDQAQNAAANLSNVLALSIDDLLAREDIDLVLNLTIPAAHAKVSLQIIAANKHVYSEKPLAVNIAEADEIIAKAKEKGVHVFCAPDTILGTGIQSAYSIIESGKIGVPMAASATMVTPGHERWHPQADFYYKPGGGPLLDMGPYYVSALVMLLGSAVSVTGVGSRIRKERKIQTGPRAGEVFSVEVDSHITATIRHQNGAISTLIMSFDSHASRSANIEIHGTLGSLAVPDPNNFDGDNFIYTPESSSWQQIPAQAGYKDSARGVGLYDLLISDEGKARLEAGFAYHCLEIMEKILLSCQSGQVQLIESRVKVSDIVQLQQLPLSSRLRDLREVLQD